MAKMMSEKPNAPATRAMHIRRDGQCASKAAAREQLTFTLVEQDRSSPVVIAEWIKQNIMSCPAAKLYDALEVAIAIRESEVMKKDAD